MSTPATATRRGALPLKLIHIVLLLAATVIASLLIRNLINEREERQSETTAEFTRTWGPQQSVYAPVVVFPVDMGEGRPRQFLKIAPTTLVSDVRLKPETRKRGLFAATIYTADVAMAGTFEAPRRDSLNQILEKGGKLRWHEGFVILTTRGLQGVRPEDSFHWNGQPMPWRTCRDAIARQEDCRDAAMIIQPSLLGMSEPGEPIAFQLNLTLRGTSTFTQILEGAHVTASMAAPWPTPSFVGNALPSTRTVNEDGFQAHWQSMEPSQSQIRLSVNMQDFLMENDNRQIGVQLLEATPIYRMINRVSKYGLLFVTLAFTTYFLFEMLARVRIHTVQYGLLGVSLTLFPLLLVSFAEPLGYGAGYMLAAALIGIQASAYTAAVTRRVMTSVLFAAMLAGLFGFLYVLLSLETYALVVGSVALFLVLSLVMALTQRIDWWGER